MDWEDRRDLSWTQDVISSANLWLTRRVSIHLLDHSSICLLCFSLSVTVSSPLLFPHRGPAVFSLIHWRLLLSGCGHKRGRQRRAGWWWQEEECRGLIRVWSDGRKRRDTMNRHAALGDKQEPHSCCGVQKEFYCADRRSETGKPLSGCHAKYAFAL